MRRFLKCPTPVDAGVHLRPRLGPANSPLAARVRGRRGVAWAVSNRSATWRNASAACPSLAVVRPAQARARGARAGAANVSTAFLPACAMFRKCALHTALAGLARPRHGFQLRVPHAVASQVFSCGEHQDTEQGQVVRAERDPWGDSRPVPPRVKGVQPPPNCPRAPAISRQPAAAPDCRQPAAAPDCRSHAQVPGTRAAH